MTQEALYRRISRRETHSSRSALAITVAVVVVLACAYAGVEIVLEMLGQPPLLAAPADMASALVTAPTLTAVWLIVGGVIAAVLGLLLIIAAVRASRRARHLLGSERTAVVVDDAVIASALARHASFAADVDPDNTVVTVGRRSATVRVTPSSGVPVVREAVQTAVDDQLARYQVRPQVRARVRVDEHGKVGA